MLFSFLFFAIQRPHDFPPLSADALIGMARAPQEVREFSIALWGILFAKVRESARHGHDFTWQPINRCLPLVEAAHSTLSCCVPSTITLSMHATRSWFVSFTPMGPLPTWRTCPLLTIFFSFEREIFNHHNLASSFLMLCMVLPCLALADSCSARTMTCANDTPVCAMPLPRRRS